MINVTLVDDDTGSVSQSVLLVVDPLNCNLEHLAVDDGTNPANRITTDVNDPIDIDVLVNDTIGSHPLINFAWNSTHIASGDSGVFIYDDGNGPVNWFNTITGGQGSMTSNCSVFSFTYDGATFDTRHEDGPDQIAGTADDVATGWGGDGLSAWGWYTGGTLTISYDNNVIASGTVDIFNTVDIDPASPSYLDGTAIAYATLSEVGANPYFYGTGVNFTFYMTDALSVSTGQWQAYVSQFGTGDSDAVFAPEDITISIEDTSNAHGTVAVIADISNDGYVDVRYTPNPSTVLGADINGNPQESFTYKFSTPFADSNIATVEILVTADPEVTLTVAQSTQINENDEFILTGTYSDVGQNETHELDVYWYDGATAETFSVSGGTFSVTHQYLDDNPTGTKSDQIEIKAVVRDSNNNVSDPDTATITINNLDPTFENLSSEADISHDGTVTIGFELYDIGTEDTHTVTVDWGDNNSDPVAVDLSTKNDYTASHQYADPSQDYQVTITATDDDLGLATAYIDVHPDQPYSEHTTFCTCFCICHGGPHTSENIQDASVGIVLGDQLDDYTVLEHLDKNNPHPIIATDITLSNTVSQAEKIKAVVTLGSLSSKTIYYSGQDAQGNPLLADGDTIRVATQFDASTLATGTHNWTIVVTEEYAAGTGSPPDRTTTYRGQQNIINQIDSEFGNRWTLRNVDRLTVQTNGVTLANGDSNMAFFRDNGGSTYSRPAGELGNSTLTKLGSGSYELTSKTGQTDTFDSAGLLISRKDSVGNETTFSYIDADGDLQVDELSQVVDPLGRTTTFTYQNGLIATITNFAGRTATFTHDGSGRLTSYTETDPDGAGPLAAPVTTFTYDPTTSLITSYSNALGQSTSFLYGSGNILLSKTDNLGNTTEIDGVMTFGLIDPDTGVGTLANPATPTLTSAVVGRQRDELDRETTVTTDRFGRITSQTDPLGRTTTLVRDDEGRIIQTTTPDPDGAGPESAYQTFYSYDAAGNRTGMTHPDGSTESWTYDAAFNRVTSHTDPLGRLTLFEIDPATGLVLSVRRVIGQIDDPINGETDDALESYTYTAAPVGQNDPPAGLLLTVTDPLGRLTSNTYNDRGLVTDTTFAVGTVDATSVQYEYDANDQLTAQVDPLGNRTEYSYDSLGRLTAMTAADPDGGGPLAAPVTTYVYNALGQMTGTTDPLGRVVSYAYDVHGRVTQTTLPDHDGDGNATVTTLDYDPAGQLIQSVDPLGRVTSYVYDDVGAMTSLTSADPDGAGPLVAPVTAYTFDALGRPTAVTDPLGHTTGTTYEDFGNRIVTTAADPDGAGPLAAPVATAQYDVAGQLSGSTDPLGDVTSYAYDALGRLLSVTAPDPDGAGPLSAPVDSYSYDKIGNLLTTTDAAGNVTAYAYDNLDRLVSVTQADPDGGGPLASPVTTYAYDDAGQLLTETDPLGALTTYAYDNLGRQTSVTLPDPDGAGPLSAPVTAFVYDAAGRLTSTTDPLGNTTTYAYDDLDNLVALTLPDPDGGGPLAAPVIGYTYDDAGQLLTETDPLGNTTTYAYDLLGRQTSVTLPDPDGAGPLSAPVTSFGYNALGQLTGTSDALGNVTTYAYDNLGRQTSITDAENGVTSFAYDAAGQLTSATDALGNVTTYAYDDLGRQTSVTLADPDGGGPQTSPVTSYAYDVLGNLIATTDPLGNATTYAYDNLRRQTSVTDSLGGATSTTYDAVGKRLSLTDPLGNVTSWAYDDLGRVITQTNELGDSRSYAYDAAGNLTGRTDRNGRVIEYDYDNLQRQTQQRWLDGVTVVNTIDFTFDAAGRTLTAADDGSAYTYTYDDLGRTTSTDNSGTLGVPAVLLAIAYDDAGRRTRLAAQIAGVDDFVNTYSYDDLSRLVSLQQSGQAGGNAVAEKRVDFSYDAEGRFSTIDRYADAAATQLVAATSYTYDDVGRLTDLVHAQGAVTLATYNWTFDSDGRVTSFVSTDGLVNYSYDTTGQLTSADYDYQADENYTYDANGNRTNVGYSTGANNRLLSDGAYDYTYDAEGNRTRKTEIASGDYVEYEWDHRNRLTSVTFKDNLGAATKVVQYDYDVHNRRIAKRVDSSGDGTFDWAQRYVYDSAGKIDRATGAALDDIVLVFDDNGSLTNRYLHGPAVDQVLADEDALGDVLWALADNLGSIRDWAEYDELLDVTTVADHIIYDSFGRITSQSDPAHDLLYAYTGREWDADIGLFYYRRRWYDPAVGRFLSEDPIGFTARDPNLQRYVHNGPTNGTDPSGLEDVNEQPWWDDGRWADNWNLVAYVAARIHSVSHLQDNIDRNKQAGEDAFLSIYGNQDDGRNVGDHFNQFSENRGFDENGRDVVESLAKGSIQFTAAGPMFIQGSAAVGGVADDLVGGGRAGTQLSKQAGRAGRRPAATRRPINASRPRHGTMTHDATAFNQAKAWECDAATVKCRFNQQLVDADGNAVLGLQPDAQRIRQLPNGRRIVDIVEVKSRSQTSAFMNRKIQRYRDVLGDQAGDIQWCQPSDTARR